MKSKVLLASMGLAAVFTACTNDELVPEMQQEQIKLDLNERPVVGDFEFTVGGETRASLADRAFNAIDFESTDGFGARIIDTYKGQTWDDCGHLAYNNYEVVDGYASSNYKFDYNNGTWGTNALMVEGNYMFYLPYNETNTARTPLKLVAPKVQTVKPNEANGDRNPIAELYAGNDPYLIGYKFIDASKKENSHSLDFRHVYAYPQITLVNDYLYAADEDGEKNDGKTFEIDSVVITSTALFDEAVVDQIAFHKKLNSTALYDSTYKSNAWQQNADPKLPVGDWFVNEKLLKEATLDITKSHSGNTRVRVDFEGGLTLAAGAKDTFYVVLPAAAYTAAKNATLKVDVYVGTKMFNKQYEINATFAPGQRYPAEEYNYTSTGVELKDSKGSLATVSLAAMGEPNKPAKPVVAPIVGCRNLEDFTSFLKTLKANGTSLVEVEATKALADRKDGEFALDLDNKDFNFVVDQNLIDAINSYNNGGTITFNSNVTVKGGATAASAIDLKDFTFGGGVTYKEGHAKNGAITGDVTFKNGTYTLGADATGAITVENGTLTLGANQTGAVTVKGGTVNAVNYTTGALTITNGTFNTAARTFKTGDTMTGGTLNLTNDNVNYDLGNLAVTDGTVNVGGKSTLNISTGSDLKEAELNNSGILAVADNQTVYLRGTLTNAGTVTLNEGASLSTYGTVTNSGTLNVTNNYGTLTNTGTATVALNAIVKDGDNNTAGTVNNYGILTVGQNHGPLNIITSTAKTTVSENAKNSEVEIVGGVIDNTGKGKLTLPSPSNYIVQYKFASTVTDETIASLNTNAQTYNINKFVFGSAVTFNEEITFIVKTLEFAGNVTLNANVNTGNATSVAFTGAGQLYMDANIILTTSATSFLIDNSVTFAGWGSNNGIVFGAEKTTFTIAKNCTLTLTEVVLKGSAATSTIVMNHSAELLGTDDKHGKVVLGSNAQIWFGAENTEDSEWGTATLEKAVEEGEGQNVWGKW